MDVNAGTFAILLTAAGAPIAAAAIWAGIDFIKGTPIKALVDGRERLAAFVGSALLVVLAYFVGITAVPPTSTFDVFGVIGAVLAWYGIARLAMATHDDVNRYANSLTGPSVP